ncbi:MAG: TolC family protein, partial [Gemmatimonadota bacterium]|nr:TolC family protein [Gemmatimonadota bacterium]
VRDWEVREARTQLLLPQASASSSLSWQGSGEQQLGSITLGDLGLGGLPSYYFSSYRVGLSYQLSGATLLAPGRASAGRDVTRARIRMSESELVTRVTNGYLEVLRQQEGLYLAERQLESARLNLRLAQGRLEVGAVTPIDVGQAEVQVGRAEVGVLQAENALATGRMRLLQWMGVPVGQEVELSTSFDLTEPLWDVDELYELALRTNPSLEAGRRSLDEADIGVRIARSEYLPTVSLSAGISGFTREASSTSLQIAQAQGQIAGLVDRCVSTNDLYSRLADPLPPIDCAQFVFTDAQRQAIIDGNDQFPFAFQSSPPSASLTVSIPIFQGFRRQRQLEAARVQRDDARHQVREQELALRADLSIGLANVRTAYQSALLEDRNQSLAEQQVRLARERYQVGAITFVELMDAETVKVQADRDRIGAIFAYHDTVTTLEALVGATLRN